MDRAEGAEVSLPLECGLEDNVVVNQQRVDYKIVSGFVAQHQGAGAQ